jgi:hypothetical protein
MDVHVFFYFKTVKRRVGNSAHLGFDAMIRQVKEKFFSPASRDVHDVFAGGIVDLQGFDGLHRTSSV